MSWFVNRVWPKCRAIVVVGIVAWAVLEPSGMAWATKGLVANGGDADTVTLFDAVTGSSITIEYPFFKRPRWVAITDDGRFAGVTNGAGKTITWLDLRDRSAPVVLGKTFVDANPKGIAIKGSVARCRPGQSGGGQHGLGQGHRHRRPAEYSPRDRGHLARPGRGRESGRGRPHAGRAVRADHAGRRQEARLCGSDGPGARAPGGRHEGGDGRVRHHRDSGRDQGARDHEDRRHPVHRRPHEVFRSCPALPRSRRSPWATRPGRWPSPPTAGPRSSRKREARMRRGSSISRRSPRRPSRSPHPPPPIPIPSGWRSWLAPAGRWRPSPTRGPARCRSWTSPARPSSIRSTPGPARRASRCFPSRRPRPASRRCRAAGRFHLRRPSTGPSPPIATARSSRTRSRSATARR